MNFMIFLQTVPIEVFIAVNHNGWHEFRICPYSVTGQESETCFNQYLLTFASGGTREDIGGNQNLRTSVILPPGLYINSCG